MHAIILGFITAFSLTYLAIPAIIRVAREKKLFDQPNERSAHEQPTPALGGIGIFGGAICGIILWTPIDTFGVLQYILAALFIVFLIGLKDDLMPVSPVKKLIAQLTAATILAYKSHIKITSLYGVMGVYELPELTSFILSIVVIVGIINAFNLIDGINGLAGSVGLFSCLTWGGWFFWVGRLELAVVAFSVAGAIVAFLKYNFTPAKIFMGDTGSLLIGTVCAILAVKFIELPREMPLGQPYAFQAAPAIAIGVLILPLYDTLRVFTLRLLNGGSPFHPDRTHIHHLLLDLGYSHMQATSMLLGVNIFIVALVFALNHLGTVPLLGLELSVAAVCSLLLHRQALRRRNHLQREDEKG